MQTVVFGEVFKYNIGIHCARCFIENFGSNMKCCTKYDESHVHINIKTIIYITI